MAVLRLTKEDRQQFREAILSAYPNPNDLEIFTDEALRLRIEPVLHLLVNRCERRLRAYRIGLFWEKSPL